MRVSLYGSVSIPKARCPRCKTEAFVLDGHLACCGRKKTVEDIDSIKRETQADNYRVSTELKARVMRLQAARCYLCGCQLDQPLWYQRGNKWCRVRVEFDHFIPRAFCATNHEENIYAMCNLCNRWKSAKMFDTRDDAVAYVMARRRKAGTMDLFTDFEREAFETSASS